YNKNKDKEINNITKYIEELNNKNYSLKLDEFTEEDLSILKSEIYKTTVMLKEQASNSLNDKINLKKSLEDISHQLKTPLTSILITTNNLIDDNNMTDELKIEFLKDIRREIMKINFLIQSLLKLSKFDSNTISYINKPVKVKNIINKSIKNVSAICDLHNINIEVTSHDDTTIICDEMWQIEAITNIIKNCLEHSKDDSKLTIFYEDNNVYTKIVIKDYGEGIPKKDIHHIFERFYKGANSNKDSIGIGLSLSKSIIEKNNGTISVKSNENKGTEFTIKYFK
ncbi:MAG TPA: two-component sensor histidine kinase, partial [Firmicutes bacterium]|nr:two-component sensor histidine kinase [Bacillota bacterium]